MNNIDEIISLYHNYGFDYRQDFSDENNLVFTITQGVFDNAIIVSTEPSNSDDIKEELSSLGYHVNFEHFTSLNNIEKNLFKGFFSVKRTKANFERDYNFHISNITKSFPTANIDYEYIQSPYHKDGEYFENEVDILNDIRSDINTNGPKLILIEAPAGFGKTCTAYEIGRILSEQDDEHLVLFAELSRDRHAKIFNHVLQRELARSFPAVPPMLVNKEIKNGKITVILDGFDELLNEREDEKFQFEKSQAMLETIGKMLENNAKIVLTTRKTAILQGDDFDEWIGENSTNFEFMRYTLKEPSAKNWLSLERYSMLNRLNINIKNLSNPVLLTFLKFIPAEQFNEVISMPDEIVYKYFNLILYREKERQNLKLEVNEQSALLTRLARHMIKLNYTKTSKESLINYISYDELELIEECRSRYEHDLRPTFEEMIEKLSNHALLDRSGIDEKIGFVNNFVLGHFVGTDIINTDEEWLADSIFIDAVINAFSSRTLQTREFVWERLKDSLILLTDEEKVVFEQTLLDRVSGGYKNSQFKEINFESSNLFINGGVHSSFFYDCTFINCSIDLECFKNNTFISCSFYNCHVHGDYNSNEFISPVMDEASRLSLSSCLMVASTNQPVVTEENQLKAYVLEKFWPIGRETIVFAHRPLFIFYRGSNYSAQEISNTIDEFRKEGVIISAKRKNWVGLEFSGQNMQIIKDILGR